jgi:hypothetical protein
MIQEKRGDSAEVHIEGLDDIDGRSLDQLISDAKGLFELDPPAQLRKHVMRSVAMTAMQNASDEMRAAVAEEINQPDTEITKAVEINGAVAEGLLALTGRLITAEEARAKIGLSPAVPAGLDPSKPIDPIAPQQSSARDVPDAEPEE